MMLRFERSTNSAVVLSTPRSTVGHPGSELAAGDDALDSLRASTGSSSLPGAVSWRQRLKTAGMFMLAASGGAGAVPHGRNRALETDPRGPGRLKHRDHSTFERVRGDEVDHLFQVLPRVPGGMWLAKHDGVFSVRDDGGFYDRNPSVVSLLTRVNKRHPELPDFGPLYLSTGDLPTPTGEALGYHEISLAFSIDKRQPRLWNGQEVRAVPDFYFDHLGYGSRLDYEQTCSEIRAAGALPAQKPVAGWIGDLGVHPTRMRLGALAEEYPDALEVRNSGQWRSAPGSFHWELPHGKFVSMADLVSTYAYLVDVEGRGWSTRLKLLLHSNRPILLQDRPWQEFFFDELVPFKHFVPVANDLHDLPGRISWLKQHPMEAAKIAAEAAEFAQQFLTRVASVEGWARVLSSLDSECTSLPSGHGCLPAAALEKALQGHN